MARKKKRGGSPAPDAESAPKPPPAVGTSMRELLQGVAIAKPDPRAAKDAKKKPPAPSPVAPARRPAAPSGAPAAAKGGRPSETLRGDDRIAYLDALAGVRPIEGRPAVRIGAVAGPAAPPTPDEKNRDAAARARLASLVAGGVRFDVRREPEWIEGLRRDAKPAVIDALLRATVGAEATLDLHGVRAATAAERVSRHVRAAQRAGLRRVLIVHGKGLHSEHGAGVLADVVVSALTEGGAAPLVVAFVTAPPSQGGAGALLVELVR
jgi:DNA-nicking Smr family endonuclease